MIPKVIHYCWFGKGPKSELMQRCIASWEKYCPDYQIICWDEDRFDVHTVPFVERACALKQWAFAADYVRLDVLCRFGGIYLDTDVELLQSLDPLLVNNCFTAFEAKDTVATGIIGCEKDHPVIRRLFDCYYGKTFQNDGKGTVITGPMLFTDVLVNAGLLLTGRQQTISGCTVYPAGLFYPTGLQWITKQYSKKTVSVHHYTDSWSGRPASNGRAFMGRVRLSAVFAGRNLLGTNRMYELSKFLRGKRSS